jgi:hypothetical protein
MEDLTEVEKLSHKLESPIYWGFLLFVPAILIIGIIIQIMLFKTIK